MKNQMFRLFRADGQKYYLVARTEEAVTALCLKIFGFNPVEIQKIVRRNSK